MTCSCTFICFASGAGIRTVLGLKNAAFFAARSSKIPCRWCCNLKWPPRIKGMCSWPDKNGVFSLEMTQYKHKLHVGQGK